MSEQRERFESWAQSQGLNTMMGFGSYYLADTAAAWEAWQATCPEGWQVVPKAVTPEMSEAYASDAYDTAQQCHDAVLGAAPKPEDV